MLRSTLSTTWTLGRQAGVLLLGAGVVAIGIAMLVLPGPGILVILAGLGILALEFDWARQWLGRFRRRVSRVRERLRRPGSDPASEARASSPTPRILDIS